MFVMPLLVLGSFAALLWILGGVLAKFAAGGFLSQLSFLPAMG